ncbi:hypothetical protein DJ69_04995 [Halorubrum persicum]|uniref:VanZ-like domain-containing protein n=1 Tax=Halorubrum persicum TaxID=1383844 RepID=A0A2G1WKT8_9EURY|nr:hypothetical protein [Halorubrum persicum]PHQ39597.1 hypothetical protein DJ69_04995 [Halorubrum persicum]
MNDSDDAATRRKRDRHGRKRLGGSWRSTAAFAALVVIASLVPVPAVGSGSGGSGVALPAWIGFTTPFHLVGYAVLAALATRAAIGSGRESVAAAAVGIGVAVAVGFGVELVQAPIAWRSFAWGDAAVNAVGAGIGGAAVLAGAGYPRSAGGERR